MGLAGKQVIRSENHMVEWGWAEEQVRRSEGSDGGRGSAGEQVIR